MIVPDCLQTIANAAELEIRRKEGAAINLYPLRTLLNVSLEQLANMLASECSSHLIMGPEQGNKTMVMAGACALTYLTDYEVLKF